MRPSIVFFAISKFYDLTCEIVEKHYKDNNIRVYKCAYEQMLAEVNQIDKEKSTDFIITGVSSYHLLLNQTNTPVIAVKVSGFDLLNVIREASLLDRNIAVISYRQKITELDRIADLLSVSLHQRTYTTREDIHHHVDDLLRNNVYTFIGTGYAYEYVEKRGGNPFLIYREDAIHQAIALANSSYIDRCRELERTKTLQTILRFCSDGIMAINQDGIITVFNASASTITGISEGDAVGKHVDSVFPGTSIQNVFRTGAAQHNEISSIGDIKIITNRVPITVNNEVKGVVATFQDAATIQQAEKTLRKKLYGKNYSARSRFEHLIGCSEHFSECVMKAKQYACSDFTIMITGETGTGKELFAQSIHNESHRRLNPFIAINCAALPESLLESELFGYEDGAFTGAKKGGKLGMFELAHGGTILLDEISELPLNLQARLLRILQERELMRLGGHNVIPVDVRIIAASNRNLEMLLQKKEFRMDLFFRLNVLNLQIPPLRERKEDIYPLFEHFVKAYSQMLGEQTSKYRNEIATILSAYSWPGNVRELKNISTRFVASSQSESDIIRNVRDLQRNLTSFSATIDKGVPPTRSYNIRRRRVLTDELMKRTKTVLDQANGNKAEAARRLQISRTTLWRWLSSSVT